MPDFGLKRVGCRGHCCSPFCRGGGLTVMLGQFTSLSQTTDFDRRCLCRRTRFRNPVDEPAEGTSLKQQYDSVEQHPSKITTVRENHGRQHEVQNEMMYRDDGGANEIGRASC